MARSLSCPLLLRFATTKRTQKKNMESTSTHKNMERHGHGHGPEHPSSLWNMGLGQPGPAAPTDLKLFEIDLRLSPRRSKSSITHAMLDLEIVYLCCARGAREVRSAPLSRGEGAGRSHSAFPGELAQKSREMAQGESSPGNAVGMTMSRAEMHRMYTTLYLMARHYTTRSISLSYTYSITYL